LLLRPGGNDDGSKEEKEGSQEVEQEEGSQEVDQEGFEEEG
jgi:hypothetical protein